MEFTQKDMAILVSMPLAIIVLNFAFSGVGLADNSVQSNDIPEYNLPEDRFKLTQDFPNYPGDPSGGKLTLLNNSATGENYYRYLYERNDEVYGIDMTNIYGTDSLDVRIFYENSSIIDGNTKTLIEEGDTVQVQYDDYEVKFTYSEKRDLDNNTKYIVDYKILDQSTTDTGTTFIERIPVVGGVVSTGEELAQVLGWIGSIFSWFVKTIFEILVAMVLTIVEAITFIVNLISWILTSYSNIITNASGFASIFIVIPSLILSLELLKVGFIVVHLLPTT